MQTYFMQDCATYDVVYGYSLLVLLTETHLLRGFAIYGRRILDNTHVSLLCIRGEYQIWLIMIEVLPCINHRNLQEQRLPCLPEK